MIPSFKEMTGMTYEELRARRFKPIMKYFHDYRMRRAVWRMNPEELEKALFYAIQEWKEEQREAAEQEIKEKEWVEKTRTKYLRAIEWLAKEGGVSEESIPVLRRAWKAVKTAKSFDPTRIFEVEGKTSRSVFTDEGLRQSLEARGKSIRDFE